MTEKRFAVLATALAILLLGVCAAAGAAIAPAPVSSCWSTATYTCPPGENR
jgi:hypothetical protein